MTEPGNRTWPSVFVSHGAPTLPFDDIPARGFLQGLGKTLGRPEAILIVSAHWETERPTVSAVARPDTIHDFFGFPRELYRLQYNAPGAPALAARTAQLLDGAGIAHEVAANRGFDHGAWVPLMLMYPEADIPVTQLSVQPMLSGADHLALGSALAPLRREDVLVIGSGGAVHNLGQLDWSGEAPPPDWATEFDDWIKNTVAGPHAENLAAYRTQAPHAYLAQPSDEHFLPIIVALGAAGPGARGELLHTSFSFGSLSMAAYRFQ